jgi:hypothetical protein
MLDNITTNQKIKLSELKIDITDKTLILEILQMFRDVSSPLYKIHNNTAVVRVYKSAYFVSEVQIGYIPSTDTNENTTGYKWYSHGTNSWEMAESLALDYLLGIYITTTNK